MRLVVTGASGNIGTALLRALQAEGGHDVVGVARRAASGEPYDSASWVQLDLGDPDAPSRLSRVVRGADAVVHLAWLFQPSHDEDYLHRAALSGTRAVLRAVRQQGVPHLVHLSSLGAYSPGPPDGRRVDESWPTGGVPSLAYSRQKAAAERLLDEAEAASADGPSGQLRIARMRPGIVVQRDAGSALLRYGVPGYVPAGLVRHLPLLPLDRRLLLQVVHSDDVARAIVLALHAQAEGAFNLVSEPTLTRDDVAAALGARGVHVPLPVLRAATAATWQLRLQPLDPGWLDLAAAVPLLDAGRARGELGWTPTVDATTALREVVDGMADAAGTPSPVLRPRTVLEQLRRLAARGPVPDRRYP